MDIRTMPLFRRVPAVVTLFSILASVPCNAETRSGFWTVTSPSADPRYTQTDFSEFGPFCKAGQCSVAVADADFSDFGYVKAPGGILFDSALGAAIQKEYLSGKTITLDREGLFYLDSMMKKRGLTAPASGYADSCPSSKDVYFLKTNENRFAAMVKVGEYIGGLNREYYYWSYRPQDDSVLHKTALYEQPESLSITVDAFSGRPNPVFALKDSAAIAEIVRQVYLSVNAFLDPSIKRTTGIACNQGLGYRLVSVTGMYGPDNPPNPYMPMLEICNGGTTYYKVSPFSSSVQPQFFLDPGRRLEKLIIRVCCTLGLTVTDSIGEVRFCDIIPDSLKDLNEVLPGRMPERREGTIAFRRLSGDRIVYFVKQAGLVGVTLFDTRGRKIAPVIDRYHLPGEHTLELGKMSAGRGVYLIDLRVGSTADHVTVPIIHNRGERK